VLGIFTIWFIAAIAAGIIASNKNRSAVGWAIATFLLSPLLIIIILVLSKKEGSPENLATRGSKKCPFCAEEIKAEAVVCKHCGKDLPEQQRDMRSGL
jgi:hypothetical protein